jgi:hypothetical protein
LNLQLQKWWNKVTVLQFSYRSSRNIFYYYLGSFDVCTSNAYILAFEFVLSSP